MSANSNRRHRGQQVFRAYERLPDVESTSDGATEHQVLSDMLADLLHAYGAPMLGNCLATATMHYEAEQNEDSDLTA